MAEESFRFPKPIPRDTTEKIAVAMTENMRALEVWMNAKLTPSAELVTAHGDLTGVGTSDHHARYTDAEADARAALQDHDHATPIAAHAALSSAHHARYTDAEAIAAVVPSDYLPLAGGTMLGDLDMGAFDLRVRRVGQSDALKRIYFHPSVDVTYFYDDSEERILLVGKTNATTPGDIQFRSTSATSYEVTLLWDESDFAWAFTDVPNVAGVDMSLVGHSHTESDISDLQSYSLTTHNHTGVYAPVVHTHTESDITDLQSYALTTHNHDTTYLELDGTNAMSGDLDVGGNTINDTTGRGIAVQKNTNQTISNTTLTAIVWQVENYSTGGAGTWDDIGGTNPTRVTVDETGLYLVNAQVFWDGSSAGGHECQVVIYVNGAATVWRVRQAHAGFFRQQATAVLSLTNGDYIEQYVWQNSGGNLAALSSGTIMSVSRIA